MTPSIKGQSLSLRHVEKSYSRSKVLTDINLEINAGEFISLLGPSGSGKSTILLSIAGFVQPTSGEIYAGSTRIDTLPAEKRNLGVVFQGYALFPHMTVAENLAYPLKIRRMPKAQIEAAVTRTLDLVQMSAFRDRLPSALSGGQQQRVALGRALVFDPTVILLDEPLSALDKQLRHDLQNELKSLHARLGTTFVNVTHDQEEAMSMSDRIVVLKGGKLIQAGSADELYNTPNSRFVAEFFGQTFFIDAKRSGAGNTVSTTLGEFTIASPIDGAEITLALRPERVRILASGETAGNSISGVVRTSSFVGGDRNVQVETGLGLLALRQSARNTTAPQIGETVRLGWAAGDEIIITK